MPIRAAKITHNESFKVNNCSIAMYIAIVLFHHVYLRGFFLAQAL